MPKRKLFSFEVVEGQPYYTMSPKTVIYSCETIDQAQQRRLAFQHAINGSNSFKVAAGMLDRATVTPSTIHIAVHLFIWRAYLLRLGIAADQAYLSNTCLIRAIWVAS